MLNNGTVLNDRYEVIKSIGEGGMANVYLAFDTILKRKVAIKMLRGDLSHDELFIKRFKREAQSATALNHPNIVQIFDIGEENGKYYIVMEYVDGITLKQLILKRKRLSINETIDIMKQVTLAMEHAHNKKIIHRDIKPHNILIQRDGRIKITDFGIAVTLNETLLTQTNSIMGSVHYLPPEQISGNIANVCSDIYSIGILMYELLTGELPFNGDSAVTVALMHVRDKFPRPRDIDSNIPQSIENIVIIATAKNPKNRYQCAMDMYEDLLKCLTLKDVSKLELNDKLESETMNNLLNNSKDIETVVLDDRSDNKRKKMIWLLSGVFLLLVIAAFAIPRITKVEEIVVPNVVNLSRGEATEILTREGFVVSKDVNFEFSNDIDNDRVIATSQLSGTKKPKGFTIVLTVSKGKDAVVLESYVGRTIDDAKASLEAMQFSVIVEEKDYEGTLSTNVVVEQFPTAGTKMDAGSVITLFKAKSKSFYPDMINDKYTRVDVDSFCKENLIKCSISNEYSDTIEQGYVMRQSIAPSTLINKDDTLSVVISQGKKPGNANE